MTDSIRFYTRHKARQIELIEVTANQQLSRARVGNSFFSTGQWSVVSIIYLPKIEFTRIWRLAGVHFGPCSDSMRKKILWSDETKILLWAELQALCLANTRHSS